MAVKTQKALSEKTYVFVAIFLCMLTSQTQSKVVRRAVTCQHGEYWHADRKCCKCPVGERVDEHCTGTTETACELCPTGQFHSEPNDGITCDKCSDCTHHHVNMEMDRPCTRERDSTCKCKANHYCPGGTPCSICEPCQECGSVGEKVACSATNNTICNDAPQDSSLAGPILGVIISVVVVGAVAAFYFWKKRKVEKKTENEDPPEEVASLNPVDEPELPERLGPSIPAIAQVITWPTVRNLALRYDVPKAMIDGCELDHPNNSEERTIKLLRIFEERKSKDAARALVQFLRQTQQNRKADDVEKILRGHSSRA